MSGALAGKHALVTGGSRGIGLAIARSLLQQGAIVTIVGRNEQKLKDAVCELRPAGEVFRVVADVTERDSVARAFDAAATRFGNVGILVNNAGEAASAPFLKTDDKLWRRLMSINLDGTFYCSQAALPGMLEAGWGRIVNIASVAGLGGSAYITAYCASKHAVVGLTRALAVEVATKGLTVNAVCPGYVDTEMVENAVAKITAKTGRTREQAIAELVAGNPQRRLIQPEEVAATVAWLCLPGSESVNGQAIALNGG